jgi:hypothetical protein
MLTRKVVTSLKTLIVQVSHHHNNTEKIAKTIAETLLMLT